MTYICINNLNKPLVFQYYLPIGFSHSIFSLSLFRTPDSFSIYLFHFLSCSLCLLSFLMPVVLDSNAPITNFMSMHVTYPHLTLTRAVISSCGNHECTSKNINLKAMTIHLPNNLIELKGI